MSSQIKSGMKNHEVKTYWGGDDKGVCLQITSSRPLLSRESVLAQLQEPGFIQLNMDEAVELVSVLGDFIKSEASRRQGLLKKQIEDLKMNERTVFDEVVALQNTFFEVPRLSVTMVSKFCPITDRE